MIISLIAALGRNSGIGYKNALPWRLPADLAFFKEKTSGHHVLMGRKTFESIGRVLPGRTFIVVTRQKDFEAKDCIIAESIEKALQIAKDRGETELMIIGGMDIYRQAMEFADRLYLTRVDAEPEADAFFPEVNPSEWSILAEITKAADEKNAYGMTFVTLDRKRDGVVAPVGFEPTTNGL